MLFFCVNSAVWSPTPSSALEQTLCVIQTRVHTQRLRSLIVVHSDSFQGYVSQISHYIRCICALIMLSEEYLVDPRHLVLEISHMVCSQNKQNFFCYEDNIWLFFFFFFFTSQVALFPLIRISKHSWGLVSCLSTTYWKPIHCWTLRYCLIWSFVRPNIEPNYFTKCWSLYYGCHVRWATAKVCPSLPEYCCYTWGKKMPSICSSFWCMTLGCVNSTGLTWLSSR